MSKSGRLNKKNIGFSMPVDAPLYSKPPIYYKDVEAISFTYETDEDAVLDILPEGLEINSPPMANLIFIKYPFSTLGPYDEVILGISCLWQGKPRFYIAHIVLNTDIPLAAGREIWGYPKKLAHITLEKEGDLITGTMERPWGNRICTGVIRPETPIEVVQAEPVPGMSLRVIPSPEEGEEPSLMDLVEVPPNSTTKEAWQGPGFAQYNSTSIIDPWHRIAIKKPLMAVYRRYDQILNYGKVVKRY
ncbi:MAG: acetoacetate decarboxylase family protein [Dehalococcoidales bacterium]|nr:acetoacetate decarboxylase family protein [Dehalococcoidales bacterium]